MTIRTNVKRTKGKTIRDIGMIDYFKYYNRYGRDKGRKPVNINKFRAILNDFNKELLKEIVENAETIKLPYQLGYLGIIKYKVNFNPDKQGIWKVDYKRSKELGMIVYYDQPFRYKWKWLKAFSMVTGKKHYKFVPCRAASRAITKALNNNPNLDYGEKLV